MEPLENQPNLDAPRDAAEPSARPPRATCYRCFRPQSICGCAEIVPLPTRTRFVLLMHPKEWKQEKAATGRLAHLCLENSEIHMGVGFDDHAVVQAILRDPANFPVLLFPGREATNLSHQPLSTAALAGRRLVVLILDATWALGRKMLRLSPTLQRLPKIMFTPSAPSRFVIKQQPQAGCLSTIEAAYELLTVLVAGGHEAPANYVQLLDVFDRMQRIQLACASDPNRAGYRHRPYRPPTERRPLQGRSGARRMRLF